IRIAQGNIGVLWALGIKKSPSGMVGLSSLCFPGSLRRSRRPLLEGFDRLDFNTFGGFKDAPIGCLVYLLTQSLMIGGSARNQGAESRFQCPNDRVTHPAIHPLLIAWTEVIW